MKLTIDTQHDEFDEVVRVIEALYNESNLGDRSVPHLNMTAAELAEAESLGVSTGVTSYGERFDKSPAVIAMEAELAGKPGGIALPLAAPLQAVQSAGANSTPSLPSTAGAAELDVNGLPWDARIHASTKGKNADGRWKAKRGVEESIVAAVTAELRQLNGAQPGATALPAGGVLGAVMPAPLQIQAEGSAAPVLAMPTPTLTLPVVAEPQLIGDFVTFVTWATANVQGYSPTGTVSQEAFAQALIENGAVNAANQPDPQVLQGRADLVPKVHASILRLSGQQ